MKNKKEENKRVKKKKKEEKIWLVDGCIRPMNVHPSSLNSVEKYPVALRRYSKPSVT